MKNLRVFALAALVVCAAGCKNVVEDLNVTPNNFTEISTELLLNHSVLNMASVQEAEPARIAGMWTDQFTGCDRQYIAQDNYRVSDATFDAIWADLYRDGVAQAQLAKQQAAKENAAPLQGLAEILEGYYFAEAALLFGDVPFTEANQANAFPDPKYDGQTAVLDGALRLMADGVAKSGTFNVTFQNQVLTGGATWGEFASALEARYRLSMKDYAGALAAAEAANFDSFGDEVSVIHSKDNFKENLFFQFEAEQRADYLCFNDSYVMNVLSDTTDVTRTTAKTNDANRRAYYMYHAGGLDRLNTNDGGIFAADKSFPIMSYPEVQLIIAETAMLIETPDTDKAIAALNNARNYWDDVLGTDDYQDLVAADFADNAALLHAIRLEKFVSVFGTPTFYDVIRTNNAVGTVLDGKDTPAQRFLYPASESSSNSSFPGLKTLDDPTPINM